LREHKVGLFADRTRLEALYIFRRPLAQQAAEKRSLKEKGKAENLRVFPFAFFLLP
jgi:hypothetical protein